MKARRNHFYLFNGRVRYHRHPVKVVCNISDREPMELEHQTDVFMNPILGVYAIHHVIGRRPLRA